jgi:hypothetical protein
VHVKVETRNAYTWVWKHDHDCPVAFSPAYKTCEEQPAGCYGAEHVYNPWDLRTICPYDDWWVVPDAARGNRGGTRILHEGAHSTWRILPTSVRCRWKQECRDEHCHSKGCREAGA